MLSFQKLFHMVVFDKLRLVLDNFSLMLDNKKILLVIIELLPDNDETGRMVNRKETSACC